MAGSARKPILVAALGALALIVGVLVLRGGELETADSARPAGLATAASPVGVSAEANSDTIASKARSASEVRRGEPLAAAPIEAESRQPTGFATLNVRVLGVENGTPLPGVRLALGTDEEGRPRSVIYRRGHQGSAQDSLLTDFHGLASFRVPAGKELRLHAWTDARHTGSITKEVSPLAPLAVREVDLHVSTRLDVALQGRVVRATDGTPIAGAEVLVRSGGATLRSVETNADGRFWTWSHSREDAVLFFRASRMTPALIAAGRFESSDEGEREVALKGTAGLILYVTDAALLPSRGSNCVARVIPARFARGLGDGLSPEQIEAERFTYAARTNGLGVARFVDLPADVPLRLEVRTLEGSVHPIEEQVTIGPGEVVDVTVRLSAPLELSGTLSNHLGEPVAGKELFLIPEEVGGRRILKCEGCPKLRTKSGSDGSFVFGGAPEGRYLVGPSPACDSRPRENCPPSTNFANVSTIAVPVQLGPGEENHIDLVVGQDLLLEGRVVDAKGHPVRGATVLFEIGPRGELRFETASESGGRFRSPWLADGAWRVRAVQGSGSARRSSKERLSEPGAEDLELVLEQGGSPRLGGIRGALVDVPNPRMLRHLTVSLLSANGRDTAVVASVKPHTGTGAFQFDEVAPGDYVVSVPSWIGNGQQLSVQVAVPGPGITIDGVELSFAARTAVSLKVSEKLMDSVRAEKNGARPCWTYTARVGSGFELSGSFWGHSGESFAVPDGYVEVTLTEVHTERQLVLGGMAERGEILRLEF